VRTAHCVLHGQFDTEEYCVKCAHAAGRKEAFEEVGRAWNASRLDAEEEDGVEYVSWIAGFDDWLRIQRDREGEK